MSLNKRKLLGMAVLGILLSINSAAFAGDTKEGGNKRLLDILLENGYITKVQHAELKKVYAKEKQETDKIAKAAAWTNKVKLKGDIRLRYQDQNEDNKTDRDRGRVRYRVGIIATPRKNLEVGAGLASGGGDLRSTNQTFDATFSSKGINLDYAYAQYKFNHNFKAIAGKFKRKKYLYQATDLMWDGDINPEGASVHFSHKNSLGKVFANTGLWVLEENSGSNRDPYMFYAQLGQKFGVGKVFGKAAVTYYTFEDITALGAIPTVGSNTDFRFGGIYSFSGEVGVKNVFGSGVKVSAIGDWVKNDDTITSQDTGHSIGTKISRGPVSFKFIYADLEANAVPDILPDSDRFNGLTGIESNEFILNYKLWKNVTLGLDYYNSWNTVANTDQNLVQADVVVKF